MKYKIKIDLKSIYSLSAQIQNIWLKMNDYLSIQNDYGTISLITNKTFNIQLLHNLLINRFIRVNSPLWIWNHYLYFLVLAIIHKNIM